MSFFTENNIKYFSSAHNDINDKVHNALSGFVNWLYNFGELSQDHYDFWATSAGQRTKSIYYKMPKLGLFCVAPFICLDHFVPSTRKIFRKKTRFPIADAHFAMGFAYFYRATGEKKFYHRAVHFLDVLKETRCQGYANYGWGYPFDWMTNGGRIKKFKPLITTTPYVYEAFASVFEIDGDYKWLEIMHSIAEHVANDYCHKKIKKNVYVCSYVTKDQLSNSRFRHIVNANAYRAFMLFDAAQRFNNERYRQIAQGNLNFVFESQQSDGSWMYSIDGADPFVDNFHTCFVLKNLMKIERLTGLKSCRDAIRKGLKFYIGHLLDDKGLPMPFAKSQRATLYRQELYDYAECINLMALQIDDKNEIKKIPYTPLEDLLSRWQKPDGSFRTRRLLLGWNNIPYHRWAQSQTFRSLSLWYLNQNTRLSQK